ncbi:MAG: Crp/Fnr family transcriptional regulator [Sphingobium limneticum]
MHLQATPAGDLGHLHARKKHCLPNGALAGTLFLEANNTIIKEGAPLDYIHVMHMGWACRYNIMKDGKRQISAFLLPGDVCESTPMYGTLIDYSVCTLTPSLVKPISIEKPVGFGQPFDQLQSILSGSLLEQRLLRAWLANLSRRSAYNRVAWLICELHERLSIVGLADETGFDCPLTQEVIADAVGLTSVHVNRVMKQFRDENLFSFRSGRVAFAGVQKVRKLCGFDPAYLHLDLAQHIKTTSTSRVQLSDCP